MRILLLACLRAQTGNSSTASRIQSHLEAAGHTCVLKDAAGVGCSSEVGDLVADGHFDAGIVIHLYKGGRLLLGSGIPFGAVFGGTDVNEDIKNEEKARVMGAVLEEARFAVAFTCQMKEAADTQWPQCRNKIYVQPQGILTSPTPAFNSEAFLRSTGIPQRLDAVRLFVLVCGLRRVKDPLFLVDAFSEWHRQETSVYMIIIGPTGNWGAPDARDASTGPSGGHETLLRCGQHLHLRGNVCVNSGGHGSGGARAGEEHPRKCCSHIPRGHRAALFRPPGICSAGSAAHRQSFCEESDCGKREGIREKASLVGAGKRRLPEPRGRPPVTSGHQGWPLLRACQLLDSMLAVMLKMEPRLLRVGVIV